MICFCIFALLGFFRIITLTKAGMRILKNCHSSDWKLKNAKKSKIRKKAHQFLGNVSFTKGRSNILVMWRRQEKGENGALYQDGFDECVFYQGEKQYFEKKAIHAKT